MEWVATKISTLVFEAKYYLVGPRILLMVIYSIFSQTGKPNSWFPPLEYYHFTWLVTFHTSCAPGMVNKMDPMPSLSSFGNCPKLH